MDFGTSRDIALIFISIQGFIMALVPLALVGGLAYGIFRLHRWLRPALQQAQVFMQQVNDKVREVSQNISAPMITARSKERMVTTIFDKLISGGNR